MSDLLGRADPVVVGALLLVLLLGLLLGRWLSARGRAHDSQRRNRVAQDGEHEAEAILAASGYEVVDRQVRARFAYRVDGEETEVEVRADLLVRRRGRTLVAEVKTGQSAPDPTYPPTRRQLLEYATVFGADEVLLVDVPARAIRVVSFG